MVDSRTPPVPDARPSTDTEAAVARVARAADGEVEAGEAGEAVAGDAEADETEAGEAEDGDEDVADRYGFTLLEVLIALAIFGVALSSLLTSQLEAMRATSYARGLTAASYLAEYQLIEIEYSMRKEGWVQNDVDYKGDFDAQGWPDIRYECLVDFIELPEYNELVNAQEASEEAAGEDDLVQDAGEQAFGMLGMVWPMIKAAIENSIRRAQCTVFWSDGKVEYDYDVETFWVDVNGLNELPGLGGEVTDEDDMSSDDADENAPAGGSTGGAPSTRVPAVTSMGGGGKGG